MSMDDGETLDEFERRLRHRIKTDGVEASVDAAIAVLRDPKAAAPAKATMATNMLRAAGYFKEKDEAGDALAQMTPAQLNDYVVRAERELALVEKSRAKRKAVESADGSVFD